jgi:hypothetical protein
LPLSFSTSRQCFIIKKRYLKKVVFVFCASAFKKLQNSLFGKEQLIL